MDCANYGHIIAQIKKSSPLPHHIYPSHNLLSIDTLDKLRDDFPGSFPCYVPFEYEVKSNMVFLPGYNLEDDSTDLVKKKLRWERKLNSIKPIDLNSVIKSVEKMKKNKPIKLSAAVRNYVDHFCNDPEPNFNGSYNWLYTGGSLTTTEGSDGTALIYADYSGKKPGFSIIKLDENLDKIGSQSFYQLKTFSPILQITCKAKPEHLLVGVRQKNQVSLFRINNTSTFTQPKKILKKKADKNKLIISADISANCESTAISDTNYDVHVFDLETGTKIFGYVGKKLVPKSVTHRWGQVSFQGSGLHVAFRNRLHVLDVRDADENPKLSFDPSSSTNDCEGISCMANCTDSNYLYLALTHHLLQLDLRNKKPVQKWTHLMNSPPQFVSSVQSGEQELLVLQSWKVDEVVGVTNDRVTENCFLSKSLPCLFRSIKEELMWSRCQGMCLNPSLIDRVDFAITGIRCLKSSRGEVFMFTQNSGGDVFLNKIRKKITDRDADVEERKEAIESIKALESHLEKLRPKTVQKTLQTVDMSHALEDLESTTREKKPSKEPETCWKHHKTYAPESLKYCRDVLARSFLRVWGYGSEESDHEDEVLKSQEKVLEWMTKI